MWRLLLGRGLGRCWAPPARPACAASPAAPPNDSRGPSPERAPGCQNGQGGGRQQPLPGLVPRYSVLEAVTWGALGALLLQLVRQVSWLRSLADARREHRSLWLSSLPSQQTGVTEASTSCPSAQLGSYFQQEASPEVVSENGIPSVQGESQPWAEVGQFHTSESSSLRTVLCTPKGDPAQRGHLEEAAFQLQQIFRIDISIALNILGIESMRAGHYRVAYTCFKLAADRGYSKAQFNVGLCYEHGRGTEKDLEKAAFYYYHAASSRHPMAQYRYARYLLCHRPENEWDRHQKAVTLLEQAATAGITEAQAYLGVFYMRGLQPKEKRGLKYLLLAAKNGDHRLTFLLSVTLFGSYWISKIKSTADMETYHRFGFGFTDPSAVDILCFLVHAQQDAQSRYHVGVCYEKGLGVQQNLAEAMKHYRQSAAAGNRNARERLRVLEEEVEDVQTKHPFPSGIRASSSSPCFWTIERVPAGLHATQPRQSALALPHSWSADGLHMMMLGGAGWSRALGNRATSLELQCLEPHHCCF